MAPTNSTFVSTVATAFATVLRNDSSLDVAEDDDDGYSDGTWAVIAITGVVCAVSLVFLLLVRVCLFLRVRVHF